ncbi:TPA: hypothetical protein I7763_18965 [Vibrio vulnificus]|nr:hypothetical protein [Vibrio vulnificus]
MNISSTKYRYQSANHALKAMIQASVAVLLVVLFFIPTPVNPGESVFESALYYYSGFVFHWAIEIVLILLTAALSFIHIKLSVNCWQLYKVEKELE